MQTKALVLGGGGLTGIAWQLGLLAGWAEEGLTLTDADLVVGTSAGAVIAAQLCTDCDPRWLYENQMEGLADEKVAALDWRWLLRMGPSMMRAQQSQRARARIGRKALEATTESQQERRETIEQRLPVHSWPDGDLRVTAVNAETGEFRQFDRDDGVPLVDAVAASCAVPGLRPPVTIDGQRWIDGGVRSGTNIDVAAEYDRVLAIAPMNYGTANFLRELRQKTTVMAVAPDVPARKVFGNNQLDPARVPAAGRAGHAQAGSTLAAAWEIWEQG